MMQPIITNSDILNYIPQRPPIVMIDAFYGIEDQTSTSSLTIKSDNFFVKNGECAEQIADTNKNKLFDQQFLDGGIIEHIAQSGAMHIGYLHKSRGENVPLGLIGSINKLTINRLPKVSETIVTTITFEAVVGDITLIAATVKVNDEIIATGKMKVATPNQYNN